MNTISEIPSDFLHLTHIYTPKSNSSFDGCGKDIRNIYLSRAHLNSRLGHCMKGENLMRIFKGNGKTVRIEVTEHNSDTLGKQYKAVVYYQDKPIKNHPPARVLPRLVMTIGQRFDPRCDPQITPAMEEDFRLAHADLTKKVEQSAMAVS